jgi:hypothetical protein
LTISARVLRSLTFRKVARSISIRPNAHRPPVLSDHSWLPVHRRHTELSAQSF